VKYPGACIALFARVPVAGQVKTRLIPALGVEGACRLHEQLLARILGVLQQQELCAAELWLDAPGKHPLIDNCDLPQQLQQGADLGARMAHAAATILVTRRQVLIIGTDTPTLDTAYLQEALQALEQGADVVLGPAFDGGYVLIGLNWAHPSVFDEVDWGTERVLQQTLDRVAAAGLRCQLLEPQPDVDRPEDLRYLS
jgi:uncharacterized protein